VIFLTVGHQTPFDRLVRLVDDWAGEHPDVEIKAQIGDGAYEPRNMSWQRWLTPDEFEACIEASSGVVAHAGTGTIIQVLLRRRPLLVLPRRAALGETRNDHQVGTAQHFAEKGYLTAAFDERALREHLEHFSVAEPRSTLSPSASPQLIGRLQRFIHGEGA